eukprot:jgi/Hompol1/1633/HPOL_002743-RA
MASRVYASSLDRGSSPASPEPPHASHDALHPSATATTTTATNPTTTNSTTAASLQPSLDISSDDPMGLERAIFTAVNEGNREHLLNVFEHYPSPTAILQMLLTTTYPNRDGFYQHDPEVIHDAHELLGPSLEHLNAIQISCILGDEEIALDILSFVVRVCDEIEARKVLYEFMGRIWGNGNTVLHLASFLGMSDLVKRLLELGAAAGKLNERKYRPVDCADDDLTRRMFEHVTELDANKHHTASIPQTQFQDTKPSTLSEQPIAVEQHSLSLAQAEESTAAFPSVSRVATHSKSLSWDSNLRERSSSASSFNSSSPRESRTKKSRGASSSSSDFRFGELSRDPSADDSSDTNISGGGGNSSGSRSSTSKSQHHDRLASEPTVATSQTGTTTTATTAATTTTTTMATMTATQDDKRDATPASSSQRRQKPHKSVSFDAPTMILDLCQHDDPTVNRVQALQQLLKPAKLPSPKKQIPPSAININEIFTPQQHLTPLHVACSHGATALVELLLTETHCAVNVRDREGWTPLHCASAEGHMDVLALLGRCQGTHGNEQSDKLSRQEATKDWFYPVDGPIDLIALNEDDEVPEDVALEEKAEMISKFFQELKTKYPPPSQSIQMEDLTDSNDIEDLEDDSSSTASSASEDSTSSTDKPAPDNSSFGRMAAGLSHAPSMMQKSTAIRARKELIDDDANLVPQSIPVVDSLATTALLGEQPKTASNGTPKSSSDSLHGASSATKLSSSQRTGGSQEFSHTADESRTTTTSISLGATGGSATNLAQPQKKVITSSRMLGQTKIAAAGGSSGS